MMSKKESTFQLLMLLLYTVFTLIIVNYLIVSDLFSQEFAYFVVGLYLIHLGVLKFVQLRLSKS